MGYKEYLQIQEWETFIIMDSTFIQFSILVEEVRLLLLHYMWVSHFTLHTLNGVQNVPKGKGYSWGHLPDILCNSGTPLNRPPLGPVKVSLFEGCPHFRGEFVLISMLWDFSKWPEYRGGHISEGSWLEAGFHTEGGISPPLTKISLPFNIVC